MFSLTNYAYKTHIVNNISGALKLRQQGSNNQRPHPAASLNTVREGTRSEAL